jgi:hypothetical protein
MQVTKDLPKNEGDIMNEKELLSKLGIEEPTEEMVSVLETFAKDKTKGIEEMMQKRINSLTREKHTLSDEISGLKADVDSKNAEFEKLQKNLTDYSSYKEQFDKLKQEQHAKMNDRWKQALEKLNVSETDKRYDNIQKIKARLTLKDKPEDYKPEEIEKNLEIYEIYAEAGAIDRVESQGSPNVPPTTSQHPPSMPKGGVVSQAAARMIGKK